MSPEGHLHYAVYIGMCMLHGVLLFRGAGRFSRGGPCRCKVLLFNQFRNEFADTRHNTGFIELAKVVATCFPMTPDRWAAKIHIYDTVCSAMGAQTASRLQHSGIMTSVFVPKNTYPSSCLRARPPGFSCPPNVLRTAQCVGRS